MNHAYNDAVGRYEEMNTKVQLRKDIVEKLARLDSGLYQTWSNEIAEKLFMQESWQNSDTIGIVISRKPEVRTTRMIKHAWELGKRVVIPKCHHQTRAMTFHEITSYNQLEVVYHGLKEPIVEKTKEVSKHDIGLIIVPGLLFTKDGYRLGFGGGYYDRFLVDYPGRKLALAFEIQLADELPIDPFDIPVDNIITNKEVLTCERG